jgi:hypothetical protein
MCVPRQNIGNPIERMSALSRVAVDHRAVAAATDRAFGTELAPSAAIRSICDEHLARPKPVDRTEQQLVFTARFGRRRCGTRRHRPRKTSEAHPFPERLDVRTHHLAMEATGVEDVRDR